MADIPSELQEARVFKLHLRNNGLHRFPDAKLQGTGKTTTYDFNFYFLIWLASVFQLEGLDGYFFHFC